MKLSSLMMQCGMLMPIEWVRQNGEGSPVYEAVIMAQNALREQEERSKGCDGCRWKDRHQKCSCCRRNRDMKDCYESGRKLEVEG